MKQALLLFGFVLVFGAACKKSDKGPASLELPPISAQGINILYDSVTTVQVDTGTGMPWGPGNTMIYSMAANVPQGKIFKVRLQGGDWGMRVASDSPKGWTFTTYDAKNRSQEFTAKAGMENDLQILFSAFNREELPDTIQVDYYIDNIRFSRKSIITRF